MVLFYGSIAHFTTNLTWKFVNLRLQLAVALMYYTLKMRILRDLVVTIKTPALTDESLNQDSIFRANNSYFKSFSSLKYSLVSLITVLDNKNTAIKLGIIISPLNVSATSQISPKSIVAPIIATNE